MNTCRCDEIGDNSHCFRHGDTTPENEVPLGAFGWWCDPENDPLGVEVARNIPHFNDHGFDALVLGSEIVGGYEQLWAIVNGLAEPI